MVCSGILRAKPKHLREHCVSDEIGRPDECEIFRFNFCAIRFKMKGSKHTHRNIGHAYILKQTHLAPIFGGGGVGLYFAFSVLCLDFGFVKRKVWWGKREYISAQPYRYAFSCFAIEHAQRNTGTRAQTHTHKRAHKLWENAHEMQIKSNERKIVTIRKRTVA